MERREYKNKNKKFSEVVELHLWIRTNCSTICAKQKISMSVASLDMFTHNSQSSGTIVHKDFYTSWKSKHR